MKRINLRFRSLRRLQARLRVARLARADVSRLVGNTFKLVVHQLAKRPRIRLMALLMLMLGALFLVSVAAVDYIEPREAEIKINGQAILVAREAEDGRQDLEASEISQEIDIKRSPFEFEKPVAEGYVSQGYRRYHAAYDFATDFGAKIQPVGAGMVEFAGFTADGKGNIVVVDHGDGLKSLYAHMGKIYVGVGNVVNSQTVLGTVGLTGRTTGPHVHLEILDNDVAVDPANILPE